jgi:hypothetical protein
MTVEQQVEPTTEQPVEATPNEPAAEATKDDLLEEAKKAYAETPEAGAADPEKPEPAAEEEPNWKRLIRAREEARKVEGEAQTYAQQAKERAEAEAAAILEAARKQAAQEIEAERTRWKDRFQLDPEGALRELGDGEQVANRLIDINTPHGKAIAQLRQELAESNKKASGVDAIKADFETFKKNQAESEQRRIYESAKQELFSVHATKDAAPYLHARYNEDEIERRANEVARDWTQAKIPFALKDIAQYLEHEAKEKLSSLGPTPAQQVSAGSTGKVAPKVSANGSRTITAAASSERRAAPKAFHEMTPEEQKADLIEEARKAWRAAGGK